jgi:hypothetical protein
MVRCFATVILAVYLLVFSPVYANAYTVVKADLHLHSKYSEETGMTENREIPQIASEVEDKLGFHSALAITDHSDVLSEFPYHQRSVLTLLEWDEIAKDIFLANELFVPILQGEEITVGNGRNKDTQGHFLAYGIIRRPIIPFRGITDDEREQMEIQNTLAVVPDDRLIRSNTPDVLAG